MSTVPPVTTLLVKGPTPNAATAAHPGGFRVFLSELNPLQYIPVLGTLYRALTGDTIPETARDVGSLVVSGLTGGPVGVAINLGALAVEKAVGIDPEAWGSKALAAAGIGHAGAASPASWSAGVADGVPPPKPVAADLTPPAAAKPRAWSPAELSAYGVKTVAGGELRHGVLTGADVLNDLELARHSQDNIA